MKRIFPVLLFFCFTSVYSQHYYNQSRYTLTSPGAMKYGMYGYDNPAILSYVESPDLLFSWTDYKGLEIPASSWAFIAAVPNFSLSVVNEKLSDYSVTDYKLSAAAGGSSFSFGLGYGWSSGLVDYFDRSDIFSIGTLIRPDRHISLGFSGNIIPSGESEAIVEAAVRPLGNEFISLFGDYVFTKNRPEVNKWSAGAALEILPGVRFTGRYFDNESFSAGFQFSFGNAGVFSQAGFNSNSDHAYNVYGIRLGAYDRNPFTTISTDYKYLDINLLGDVKYRKYALFDDSKTLFDLLSQIEAAKNDDDVSGIAINMSGMSINRELIWEIREKLKEFKQSGKKVVIYIDRTGIDGYHLASVADKIVMDPVGDLTLQGYIVARQYYKNTLEKIGIGFTELRVFKFKSANESFSRTSMSDAEKEQLQKILDEYYTLAKNDICSSRNITSTEFDRLVNEEFFFLPEDALRLKLVDTLGRWDAVENIITLIEGEEKILSGAGSLAEFRMPKDDYWGSKPEIAVIYAIGACAMDEGINARSLSKVVEYASDNDNIKAIVLRVDSPGGDALASDLVAEALRKAQENKPVIVSQGYVAASGGYWLSMYADEILAAPTTITGSIGVASGWFYNKDFKQTLGVSNDYIKRGDYADFGFGMRIPLIGLSLPDKDLSPKEKEVYESRMTTMYKQFVGKVSLGRNKSKEDIEAIAQGRVWTGNDGLKNGLIDMIGGLDKAVDIAAENAGLTNKEYAVEEYPEMPWFDLGSLLPGPFGADVKSVINTEPINNLLFRMKYNGLPMPMLPIDDSYLLDDWGF